MTVIRGRGHRYTSSSYPLTQSTSSAQSIPTLECDLLRHLMDRPVTIKQHKISSQLCLRSDSPSRIYLQEHCSKVKTKRIQVESRLYAMHLDSSSSHDHDREIFWLSITQAKILDRRATGVPNHRDPLPLVRFSSWMLGSIWPPCWKWLFQEKDRDEVNEKRTKGGVWLG
ncbi:uncharacterized protein LOC107267407 isoform X2 [Cephus cinctus]|uniref:Uncharacterized protein LOC107267407 isoform X2 n=1 Tax=Cephus cinctus TaxID=211228 RepID=A0AAJ7W100_CEPCN|nr:uncharacterized protein LOC107267407 isoform X2 [Cephus cinctus]